MNVDRHVQRIFKMREQFLHCNTKKTHAERYYAFADALNSAPSGLRWRLRNMLREGTTLKIGD